MAQTAAHELQAASERDLVRAVVANQPGAWRSFYARYERLMVTCIRKVFYRYTALYVDADIEDATNMVCLNLIKDDYKRLRAWDPARGCKLSSWVGLIATNTALDALRRRAPVHESLDDDGRDEPREVPDERADPNEALERQAWRDRVAEALAQLCASDRLFMELYYDRELEPGEIARRMQISINTVYSRKNKVREKLRRLVQRDDFARKEAGDSPYKSS